MRTRAQLYDSLLKFQVDLSFETETSILKQSKWKSAKTVLDYGCGNGYFSYRLAINNPEKTYYCCDRDSDILENSVYLKKLNVIKGEYPNVELCDKIDFFIIRHLTSYLNDRDSFFSWIRENASENASILLIDAFDENFLIEPIMPQFQKGLDQFYEKVELDGGERNLFSVIVDELKMVDFELCNELKVVVNSEQPLKKEKLFIYMNLVAELDNGLPLSEAIREELMQWVTDPKSFLQYGLFVSLFELK